MKQLLLLSIFITSIQFCNAQEEIFFNDINIDKNEIKIAKVIAGLEFSSDFVRILPASYSGYEFGSVETNLSYFHENSIANAWSLYKSIGLGNSVYQVLEYSNTTNGYSITPNQVSQYNLALDIKLEPRWYFDQVLRYRHNKNTRNNSGWFLSVPLTLSINLLQQPVEGHNTNWLPQHLDVRITAPITIGFRNAFAKNCLLEMSVGYIPYRAWLYNGSIYSDRLFYFKSATKVGLFSADSFNSELKFAYTF